ncbi:thiopeptide-type bacteriocin biosynthesis protein [Kitasatospora sp. NPDC002227]|uniref:thiopeptide-type bacteriocin biosynthesis protein n=1 Tax=Kitasatospora sp. NPDC002227 TaxID=3154773 RepID=UPI00331C7B4A
MTADHTWLYLKLYPGRLDLLDAAALDVVAPLAEEVGAEASCWFFLRYFDTAGPHLRLRFHTGRERADRLAARRPELLGRLAALAGRSERRWLPVFPDLPMGPGGGRPDLRLDLYEPEYAKWGGQRQLAVAERGFQASSETVLELLAAADGDPHRRLALGVLIVRQLLAALGLTGRQQRDFLAAHYQWWSGARNPDPRLHQEQLLQEAHQRLLGAVLAATDQLAADQATSGSVHRLCAGMVTAVTAAGPPHKPLYLAFHHLHLALNRLGIVPTEEAVVSLLARTQLDRAQASVPVATARAPRPPQSRLVPSLP